MNTVLVEFFESWLGGRSSAVARDLKLNIRRALESGVLDETESTLAVAATATALGLDAAAQVASKHLAELGSSEEAVREAREVAAILGMLNTYYRFRHMLDAQVQEDYRSTGLRMTALANPALGKIRFEMAAFAVSVINGCPTCVTSHERVLREAGVGADKIHDLARIAAILKGIEVLARVG
jgi:alkyl hydroperoxide reductase subunit D